MVWLRQQWLTTLNCFNFPWHSSLDSAIKCFGDFSPGVTDGVCVCYPWPEWEHTVHQSHVSTSSSTCVTPKLNL